MNLAQKKILAFVLNEKKAVTGNEGDFDKELYAQYTEIENSIISKKPSMEIDLKPEQPRQQNQGSKYPYGGSVK